MTNLDLNRDNPCVRFDISDEGDSLRIAVPCNEDIAYLNYNNVGVFFSILEQFYSNFKIFTSKIFIFYFIFRANSPSRECAVTFRMFTLLDSGDTISRQTFHLKFLFSICLKIHFSALQLLERSNRAGMDGRIRLSAARIFAGSAGSFERWLGWRLEKEVGD